MISKSYVLRPTKDRDELLGALGGACSEINQLLGSLFEHARFEDRGSVHYYFWADYSEGDGWIRLVEDFEIPAQYVEVSMPDSGMLERVGSVLSGRLSILDVTALQDEARQADNEDPGALMRLGIGSHRSPFDSRTQEVVESGLGDPKREIRAGAAMATFLLKWPQFTATLETTLAREADETLRSQLEAAIQICRQSTTG